MKSYLINDPWDWVTHFEKAIAKYTGAKYAIACDSNSNALRILLHYKRIIDRDIIIPANTYISVPNQIILSGNRPKFMDIEWDGLYEIDNTGIVDAATAFYQGMYSDYLGTHMVLSFHLKKILNIGQGRMILTNDSKFEKWARPMIYDGRHKYKMYNDDEFECIGWHMYMSPESAKRGLEIFHSNRIEADNPNVGSSKTYKDLRKQPIFSCYID